jgi:hypothetical protein
MRVPVVAVVLCLTPSLAFPQSLGDLARLQACKRTAAAPAPAAPRSYTDGDLRPKEDGAATGTARTAPAESVTPHPALEADEPLGGQIEPQAAEASVREELDREAADRKQRELCWRQVGRAAHARLASAQREHDAACGLGVIVLAGG